MFALALKDFLVLDRRVWPIAGSVVFILFYYSTPAIGLALSLLPALYLTAWATSMDFAAKADSFVACLPVSRAAVVAARFATVFVAWAGGFVGALAVWAIRSAFGVFIPAAALPGIAAVSLVATLVSDGLYLAAYYVFGFQNARWANFIIFGGIGALGPVMKTVAPGSAATGIPALNAVLGGRSGLPVYAAAAAAGLVLYAACYAVSLAAYSRKEF